jgi:hypothetical protein
MVLTRGGYDLSSFSILFLSTAPVIIGTFLSFSPLKTVRQIQSDGSVGKFNAFTFITMIGNGFLWCFYGLLANSMTCLVTNLISLVCGIYYTFFFLLLYYFAQPFSFISFKTVLILAISFFTLFFSLD